MIRRASSRAVCTVTSLADSARHSVTVRTLEPISSPASQHWLTKVSIWFFSAGSASGEMPSGSKSSTSTSECGNSSARPNPPAAIRAICPLKPQACQMLRRPSSANSESLVSVRRTPRVDAPPAAMDDISPAFRARNSSRNCARASGAMVKPDQAGTETGSARTSCCGTKAGVAGVPADSVSTS